jgi:hypothetical protein
MRNAKNSGPLETRWYRSSRWQPPKYAKSRRGGSSDREPPESAVAPAMNPRLPQQTSQLRIHYQHARKLTCGNHEQSDALEPPGRSQARQMLKMIRPGESSVTGKAGPGSGSKGCMPRWRLIIKARCGTLAELTIAGYFSTVDDRDALLSRLSSGLLSEGITRQRADLGATCSYATRAERSLATTEDCPDQT